ncbi:hypothetical protein BVI2075_860006 [Burkholderia vietnamiensis]|nr:hypothetical protein BVI2075_860006 [Burkholderia vietnamiensis]
MGRAQARRDRADRRDLEAASSRRCARRAATEAEGRRDRGARRSVRAARGGRLQLSRRLSRSGAAPPRGSAFSARRRASGR